MFTFIKYNRGWWLKISSIEEYLNIKAFDNHYWQQVREQLFDPDYGTIKPFTNSIAQLIFEFKRKNNKTSILEEYMNLIEEITINQLDCLDKYGSIYLNENGGYCFGIKCIKETIQKENPIFPTDTIPNIEIKKWPYGLHYYAYVNGKEVKDEFDNIKWNTKEKAEEAAQKYIKENL